MCLLCIETAKENLKAEDFWRNYEEVTENHHEEVMEVVSETSEAYQQQLKDFILKDLEESMACQD